MFSIQCIKQVSLCASEKAILSHITNLKEMEKNKNTISINIRSIFKNNSEQPLKILEMDALYLQAWYGKRTFSERSFMCSAEFNIYALSKTSGVNCLISIL